MQLKESFLQIVINLAYWLIAHYHNSMTVKRRCHVRLSWNWYQIYSGLLPNHQNIWHCFQLITKNKTKNNSKFCELFTAHLFIRLFLLVPFGFAHFDLVLQKVSLFCQKTNSMRSTLLTLVVITSNSWAR